MQAASKLIQGARIFELPILVTEQYPKGIGRTDEDVRECLGACPAKTVEKAAFSAWAEGSFRDAMLAIDRPQVIITGIETHVCVQQAALDLKSRDYDVFVCADAVGSRSEANRDLGLAKAEHAGAWPTSVETALFELLGGAGSERFKAVQRLVLEYAP